MQSYNPGRFAIIEVTQDRIADLLVKVCQVIGFCENRFAKRAGDVAPFRSLLYNKDQFVHGYISNWLNSLAHKHNGIGLGINLLAHALRDML